MSDALSRYRSLERKLIHTRWMNLGYESAEEDVLLEDMDEVWCQLSEEERNMRTNILSFTSGGNS